MLLQLPAYNILYGIILFVYWKLYGVKKHLWFFRISGHVHWDHDAIWVKGKLNFKHTFSEKRNSDYYLFYSEEINYTISMFQNFSQPLV